MKFAVVELKYVPGKTYIVPINWIKKFNQKFNRTESFLCFISLTISDEPDFDAEYHKGEFNGSVGTYKVFVLTIKDSIEEAIIYQREKRITSLPKKFREPTNTENEISAEQKRKRRSDNKIMKTNKRVSMVKNISYLTETLYDNITNPQIDPSATSEIIHSSVEQQHDESIEPMLPLLETPFMELDGNQKTDNNDSTSTAPMADVPNPISKIIDSPMEQQNESVEPLLPTLQTPSKELNGKQKTDGNNDSTSPAESTESVSPKRSKVAGKAVSKQHSAIDRDTYATSTSTTYIQEPIDQSDVIVCGAETDNSFYSLCDSLPDQILDVSSESPQATDYSREPVNTLEYNDLIDAIQQQSVYIIPANENISGIIHSYQNGIKPGSSQITTNLATTNVPIESSIDIQRAPISDVIRFSGLGFATQINKSKIVPDVRGDSRTCDVEVTPPNVPKKKFDDLLLENVMLKKQNEDLARRNIALQDALVANTNVIPPVPFEAKDGGRLYNGTILLNKTQCEILDKTEDPQKYLNNLALAVFGSKTLKNSSVTGSVSNNYKKPAKPKLNEESLNLIYSLMATKTNCHCFNRSRINQILNKKIYNLNASGNPRKSNKK